MITVLYNNLQYIETNRPSVNFNIDVTSKNCARYYVYHCHKNESANNISKSDAIDVFLFPCCHIWIIMGAAVRVVTETNQLTHESAAIGINRRHHPGNRAEHDQEPRERQKAAQDQA